MTTIEVLCLLVQPFRLWKLTALNNWKSCWVQLMKVPRKLAANVVACRHLMPFNATEACVFPLSGVASFKTQYTSRIFNFTNFFLFYFFPRNFGSWQPEPDLLLINTRVDVRLWNSIHRNFGLAWFEGAPRSPAVVSCVRSANSIAKRWKLLHKRGARGRIEPIDAEFFVVDRDLFRSIVVLFLFLKLISFHFEIHEYANRINLPRISFNFICVYLYPCREYGFGEIISWRCFTSLEFYQILSPI